MDENMVCFGITLPKSNFFRINVLIKLNWFEFFVLLNNNNVHWALKSM